MGKSAEYYRVHLLSFPNELSKNTRKKPTSFNLNAQPSKRKQILLQSVQEKITSALNKGDSKVLHELVMEGYGDHLFGRTSWGEEARKFLKNLPHLMDNIKTLQASIVNGDLKNVDRILTTDPSLIKAKENGLLPIHLATRSNQTEIVDYFIDNFPSTINTRDNVSFLI